MAKLAYALPSQIRECITHRTKIRFIYRGDRLEAEPHLYGHSKRTGTLVLVAWICDAEKWLTLRFNEVRGLEIMPETFSGTRPGFEPYHSTVGWIDTCAPPAYARAS